MLAKAADVDQATLIVAKADDEAEYETLVKKIGCQVLTAAHLMSCVLRQELDLKDKKGPL